MSAGANVKGVKEDPVAEAIERCERMLSSLGRLVDSGQAEETLERYEIFVPYVAKQPFDTATREHFVFQARQYAFSAACMKLEELVFEAMAKARAGDQPQKRLLLRRAELLVKRARRLSKVQIALDEIEKRIALAHETDAAGDSDKAKNQHEDDWTVARYANEKRRFLRYAEPKFLVRVGTMDEFLLTHDFSLTGLRVDNLELQVDPGYHLYITVMLEGDAEKRVFSGMASVVRSYRDEQGVGSLALQFSSAEGPVMFFVRNRLLDLSELEPL